MFMLHEATWRCTAAQCVYVYMRACIYVYMRIYRRSGMSHHITCCESLSISLHMCVCVYVYMRACMNVFMRA